MGLISDRSSIDVMVPVIGTITELADTLQSVLSQAYDSVTVYFYCIPENNDFLHAFLNTIETNKVLIHMNVSPVADNGIKQFIEESKGDYLIIAEKGVVWEKNYLQNCVENLESNPSAVICYAEIQAEGYKQSTIRVSGENSIIRIQQLLIKSNWSELCGLIRAKTVRTVYSKRSDFGHALFLLAGLATIGDFIRLPHAQTIHTLPANSWLLFKIDRPTAEEDFSQKQFSCLAASLLSFLLKIVAVQSSPYIKSHFVDAIVKNPVWLERLQQENIAIFQNQVNHSLLSFFVECVVDAETLAKIPEGSKAIGWLLRNVTAKANLRNQKVIEKTKSEWTTDKTAMYVMHSRSYPAQDGADNRRMQMLKAMKKSGFQVVLFSSNLHTHLWSFSSVEFTEEALGVKIILHIGQKEDHRYLDFYKRPWQLTTPSLMRCFRKTYYQIKPSLIWVGYAFFAKLATNMISQPSMKIIDTIDLLSLNQAMASYAWKYLQAKQSAPPYRAFAVEPEFLSEDFYANAPINTDLSEYKLYSEFDHSIAISEREATVLKEYTYNTNVSYLPFTFEVEPVQNTYTDAPIFAIGPNQFNIQGYMYFIEKVLPLVRQQESSFELHVTGNGCKYIEQVQGTRLLGFVPDIQQVYQHGKFAVCPLIGATGQQLKVLEAMAHGLPVVALRNVAERCPIYHGINGFVADTAAEFAHYTLQLYQNPDLCRQMGEAARQTIREQHSEEMLDQKIAQLLSTAAYRPKFSLIPVRFRILLAYKLEICLFNFKMSLTRYEKTKYGRHAGKIRRRLTYELKRRKRDTSQSL